MSSMEVDTPGGAFPFDGPDAVTNSKTQAQAGPQVSKEEQELKNLAAYFPAFQPGHEVNFTDLLGYGGEGSGGNANQYYEDMAADHGRRRKIVDLDGEDDGEDVSSDAPPTKRRIVDWSTAIIKRHRDREFLRANSRFAELLSSGHAVTPEQNEVPAVADETEDMSAVALLNWEDQIVWGIEPRRSVQPGIRQINVELEKDDWLRNIEYGDNSNLDREEFMDTSAGDPPASGESKPFVEALRLLHRPRIDPNGYHLDFFNFSNDHLYERLKPRKITLRQTGTIELKHAGPATKLQMPFYKLDLSRDEMQHWHRHSLQFPTGIPLRFEKLVSTGRTKQQREAIKAMQRQGKKVEVEVPKTTKDLSMSDRAPFALFEYSEERPLMLSQFGMGSVMYNYYRKTNDEDEDLPKQNLGQMTILQPNDAQPYPLSIVKPGQTMRSLENNLIRAPVFEHQPEPTDFLVVRQTINGSTRYFIRQINHLFVVGQTYPHQYQIDPPTSNATRDRRTKRNRDIIRRLLLKGNDLLKEKQMRSLFNTLHPKEVQNMYKSFMTQVTSNKEKAWRMLTPNDPVSSNKRLLTDLDKQVFTPEESVILHTTEVAERLLKDEGHELPVDSKTEKSLARSGPAVENDADGEGKIQVTEVQLAPWYTSKAYMDKAKDPMTGATNAYALQLTGEGDPTGIKEGFSLVTLTRKQIGEITEQRNKERNAAIIKRANRHASGRGGKAQTSSKANNLKPIDWYRMDEERIWNAQRTSLMNTAPARYTDKERMKHKLAEAEKEKTLAGQDAYYSGSDIRLNPERKLRITRQLPDGRVQTEEIEGERLIMTYLERRLAAVPDDRLGDALGSVAAREPAVSDLVRNTQVDLAQLLLSSVHDRQQKQAKKAEKGGKQQKRSKGEITCSVCGKAGHTKAQKDVCPGRPTNFSNPTSMDQSLGARLASGMITPGGANGPLTDSSAGGGGFKLKLNLQK
ncbi:hypothetical protein QFC22_000954 [Naganishia vaughanmartiniae]|uniref:Uncharacterized protein n=1 Tax=Naganishia vaughanmartiniae TaxID=1424756 RepID=A0ACC2XN66_9TREE|nr:hypothetical protein QFC22_000954 [Naganishia vaughanmartiniae]